MFRAIIGAWVTSLLACGLPRLFRPFSCHFLLNVKIKGLDLLTLQSPHKLVANVSCSLRTCSNSCHCFQSPVSPPLCTLYMGDFTHTPHMLLGEPLWTPQSRQSPAIGCLLIPNTNPSHHSIITMQLFHYFCAQETSVSVGVPAVSFLLPVG